MTHSINVLTSILASSVRSWRGTSTKRKTLQPEQLVTLYDREGCPDCRFVREALTELNLDAQIIPCPEGNKGTAAALKKASTKNSTECTGLRAVITIKALTIKIPANK